VTAAEAELPSRDDILDGIQRFAELTEKWLSEMDYTAPNVAFPWAGKTQFGVALFLLKHTTFHLGELNALREESLVGPVEDHYVKAL
jgi:hypothetical protein